MSAFMFTWYMDSLPSDPIFNTHLATGDCSNVCGCNSAEIMILLPFMATLPFIDTSSLNVQYGLLSCFASFCLDDQPLMMSL